MIMTAALLPLLAAIPIAAAAATVLWRNPVWQRAWLLGIPVLTGLAGLDLLSASTGTPRCWPRTSAPSCPGWRSPSSRTPSARS
ncbi:hypothetical protein [Serinicoccus marinus]|uniref:hypothetical protein n=1 Tax=Serinicoccus marinus TaxID=247333 RepID=UPI001EE80228|nr:hypothetical protein [Serinicoccus marinus]